MHTNNTYQYGATDYIKSLDTPKHVSRNRGWLLDKVSNAKKLKTTPDRSCVQVKGMPDIHVMPSVRHEQCTHPRADPAIKQIHIFVKLVPQCLSCCPPNAVAPDGSYQRPGVYFFHDK